MDLVELVWSLLVLGICVGLLLWLVDSAPFIPEPFKSGLHWLIIAFAVFYVIAMLLGGATPVPVPMIFHRAR